MTQSLAHALRSRRDDGKVLPTVYPSWEKVGVRPRFGQLMMVSAAPGGAKSALITDYVRKLNLPTLYFSADTDRTTMALRTIAGTTGYPLSIVEEGLEGSQRDWWLSQADDQTKHIWYTWDASPEVEDLDNEILAYATVLGQYPSVVVMDNLKDLGAGSRIGSEHENYDQGVQFLHELSRQIGALVICLHHAVGEYENGDRPIPLGGLKGKVGKTPRLVLTLYKKWPPGHMGVCVVKNTGGPADAKCGIEIEMKFDAERMQFTEVW